MLRRIHAALPAFALAGGSLLLCTPSASAATAPPDYKVVEGVLTGVHEVDNATGAVSALVHDPFAYVFNVAVTPNGKTAYYTSINRSAVTPVNLVTGAVGRPITVAGAYAIAISPDGTVAYVGGTDGITPIRLSDGHALAPITVQQNVLAVAFAPDGQTAYVLGDDDQNVSSLLPVDVKTGAVGTPTGVGASGSVVGRIFSISPDGRTAYLPGRDSVTTVDLTSMTVGAPIDVSGHGFPSVVTVSPDGKSLWVGTQSVVLRVDLATGAVRAVPLPAGFSIADLAVTPDGRRVYVSHNHADQFPNPPAQVIWIDTTSLRLSPPLVTDDAQRGPSGGSLAITPDQAPVAKLSARAACAGAATAFDASRSSVTQGKITRYAWSFGDGATKVTTGPKTTHIYAKPGSYAASVTETDSAGTSTAVVSSGQSVLKNGGPSAHAHHTVTITTCVVSGEPTTVPASGSMAASSADASLPMTGGNSGEALALAGLLIGAGAVLTRTGRRVRG